MPSPESFRDRIADIIDDVAVIAEAAGHGVSAGAAVERVVAAVAGDDVGIAVAGAVDVGAAGQGQILDVGRQRVVGERRQHRVGALVGAFRHRVQGTVDDVGVVAQTARHRVAEHAIGAAVEPVVAAVAGERIVEAAADNVLNTGDRREAGGTAEAEIDGHAAAAAGVAERVASGAVGEAVDRVALHCGRSHALDHSDCAQAIDRDVNGVVAGGSRHRQGVGVVAAVDDVDAVADGIVERVVASAAAKVVVTEAAADDVGEFVADDGVVALAASGVLDVDQHIGADVDTLRVADRQVRIVTTRRRIGIVQELTDRGSPERLLLGAVLGPEIDGDAVGRRGVADRIAAGAAVIDVVAATLAADDLVVAAAGLHDVVAVAGMDGVVAAARGDEVVAGTGGDMRGATARDLDGGRHVIRNREVEILVRRQLDVDRGWRRGVHERVARMGSGTGRDCCRLAGETVSAGGASQVDVA